MPEAPKARIRDINSGDAEKSVIGCFLSDAMTLKYVKSIQAEDFYDERYQLIFNTLRAIHLKGQSVDFVSVNAVLNRDDLLQLMIDCSTFVVTTVNCEQYISIVKEYAKRRKIADIAEKLYKAMGDTKAPIRDAMDQAMRQLRALNDSGKLGWVPVADVLGATYEDAERKVKKEDVAIQTGLASVDYNIGGMFGGEFVIFGARPGGGKSAAAMAIALDASKKGQHAGVVSLEMSDVQYGQRIYSNMGRINGMKFRRGDLDADDFQKMVAVGNDMFKAPIHFLFKARTVEEICAMASAKRDAGELDILLVDYLQLCRTSQKIDANNERLIVSAVSREFKYLATDLRIPVVGMAQLKRPEKGANRMPDMDSLKESGALEQDADQIILLHKPDNKEDKAVKPEDRDHFDQWADLGMQYTLFNICKQRQGRVCVVPQLFIPAYMTFTGIERSSLV